MEKFFYYTTLFLIALAISCRDPYEIETGFGREGFLVVDGYINIGEGITTIKLSRSTPIDIPVTRITETGANIFIEDDQFTYPLTEQADGVYVSEELELPLGRDYRLRIITSNNNIYLSEYTTPVKTPPIDSVTWQQNFEGVKILVNTHDPINQTHYYQWQYEEVWEVQSPYLSLIKYEEGQFINRPNQEIRDMRTCWKYQANEILNIASSDRLTQDAIYLHPVHSIPQDNQRLAIRYSILVKQHALNQKAHDFFQILLKNNENLGTFSDPQPSQLIGNIQSQNTNEIVVGFIGAYTTETKRIVINRNEVGVWRYSPACEERVLLFDEDDIPYYMNFYTPTRYQAMLVDGQPVQTGVVATSDACADCRLSGGTNIIPPFWDITIE
jgi:hypothetical protein